MVDPQSQVRFARGNTGTSWLQGNDKTLPALEDFMGRPSVYSERSTRDEVVILEPMVLSSIRVELPTRRDEFDKPRGTLSPKAAHSTC